MRYTHGKIECSKVAKIPNTLSKPGLICECKATYESHSAFRTRRTQRTNDLDGLLGSRIRECLTVCSAETERGQNQA